MAADAAPPSAICSSAVAPLLQLSSLVNVGARSPWSPPLFTFAASFQLRATRVAALNPTVVTKDRETPWLSSIKPVPANSVAGCSTIDARFQQKLRRTKKLPPRRSIGLRQFQQFSWLVVAPLMPASSTRRCGHHWQLRLPASSTDGFII